MHHLLEKLHKDHRNLEKILDLLTAQLDQFLAGRESDFDLKIELLEYMETYADQGHHPLENVIFTVARPLVGERAELMDRLITQHHELGQLTRIFRNSLENIYQGGVMSRDELEVQGREFIALQRQHLALEEQEAFPMLDEVLTDEHWKTIIEQSPNHDDPVFDKPDKIRFQTLFEYLSRSE
ncbi:MAG: hemerythrin domain-containing protein [Sedimenticola sp.]|uniref:Purine catabolism protein pucG n=1 Tax=Sedimenticola thiotaurini TaxID=1543721 RepID=A0A558CSE6_9GAMM|nr:hemerythrin domain-containing protein [Sedimenticola sp.]MCW8976547.1 hemerythrin domain-containing protein [Sedimenticola sp.]MCW9022659.1 hemerythrin domain-containing protein [Sedimenticola sp.]TVT51684.1 MAG: purine catabolism protein pucG [Sedimenticola thiotaurini]